MKIIIFSDSHGDVETMYSAVEKEKPEMIIFLGDGIADAVQLNEKYPDIEMIKVLGNADSDKEDEEWIKTAEICGKRFIITHGHKFIGFTFDEELKAFRLTDESRIKGRAAMIKYMSDNDVDIFLHGHTHEPYINRAEITPEKACWIMNPGSIRRKDDGASKPVYGVLKFDKAGAFEWQFKEV